MCLKTNITFMSSIFFHLQCGAGDKNIVHTRVVQTARSTKTNPSLGIFPFILIYWIGKSKIFWKKLSFCPCLRVIFVYYYRYVVTGKQFPFYDQNLPLNVAISTSNPPRTKQEVKNIDQSLVDIKNSLIGVKIDYFSHFDGWHDNGD